MAVGWRWRGAEPSKSNGLRDGSESPHLAVTLAWPPAVTPGPSAVTRRRPKSGRSLKLGGGGGAWSRLEAGPLWLKLAGGKDLTFKTPISY